MNNIDFTPNNRPRKKALAFDLMDDLAFFMNNDPEFYRKRYFPTMLKLNKFCKEGKRVSSKAFEKLVNDAYEVYRGKFAVEGLEKTLDNEIREKLCRYIHEQETKNCKDGVYDDAVSESFKTHLKILEDISRNELNYVEKVVDELWSKLGIDIEFGTHFFQRVNDERNGKPITVDELVALFQKEFKAYGIQISNMRRPEAVLKDILSNINIPFVLKNRGDHKELLAKTVMRKQNFGSSNPFYIVR